ncbi:peptidase [Deinococcus phoenicis]|uniref:Peptidase n=1 Tax=Deinococcus phoenicis TaxID=1476583 RepID=A0A016QRI8_9DEIO|nr:PepSY domain-containing protein [Deinococcus phoenicis]EYB68581.1 peptidase [Deinococcus phoenicis]
MNKNTRNILLILATTAAVGVPLAGYAFAQTTPAPTGTAQSQNSGGQNAEGQNTGDNDAETQDDQTPAYKSSIQLPAEQQGTELPDAQEEAQLRALARITPQQASQAAQAAVPGTVGSVKLEDENGNLVYEVVIGKTGVVVDAGNGRVLHQEAADSENGQEDNEQGETNSGQ